jgi:chromate transporter
MESTEERPAPATREIFFTFLRITLLAFGNALSWVHRGVVVDRKWLTEEQFAETLALCQFLPGPNITNFAVIVGWRFRGAAGAIAALTALIVPPTIILTILGAFYDRVADVPIVRGIFNGLSAAAAGLLVALVVRLLLVLAKSRPAITLPTTALSFGVVFGGILSVPLALVTLGPISVALAWFRRT